CRVMSFRLSLPDPCAPYYSFVVLSRPVAPLDLHSFPTRRSSDLRSSPAHRGHRQPRVGPDQTHRSRGARSGPYDRRDVWATHSRSEEHTSELQSRENLVCRLLLEKKKKTSKAGHMKASQDEHAGC